MSVPSCWVVTDGKPGMENQCIGVAQALGLTPVIKRVRLRTPWKQLSPSVLRFGNRWSLSADSDPIAGPFPDLLIATGRHSVSTSLAVGSMNGRHTYRVQIQDPAISPGHFDLVIVPRHDRLRGDNVLVTKGAPHKVSPASLAAAGRHFASRLDHLPQPRVAVLVGGSNGVYRLTPTLTRDLAEGLVALTVRHGASLMVTTSRRTGADNEAVLREALLGQPGEVWDGSGENPYVGYLAHADAIIVTADSVNMVCEACATGKPVHVVDMQGGSAKFSRFHEGLRADGLTRPFDGSLGQWSYTPLDEAAGVAAIIRQRLGERGVSW